MADYVHTYMYMYINSLPLSSGNYINWCSCNFCRSCGALEDELRELSQQKIAVVKELEKLKTEEQHHRSQVCDLKSQVTSLVNLNKGSAKKPQNVPLSTRNDKAAGISTEANRCSRPHLSNGGDKKPTKNDAVDSESSESEREEEEEVEVDATAGSMHLMELTQPSSKPKVYTEFLIKST